MDSKACSSLALAGAVGLVGGLIGTAIGKWLFPSPSTAASVQRIHSNAIWEEKVSYCRVMRVGSTIAVTGTAPVDSTGSKTHAPGDAHAQTIRCLELIQQNLAKVKLDDPQRESIVIIRTRMFVTDISRWTEYGAAHGKWFRLHPPTTSMIEIKRLIDPEMMIEIEADAVVVTH